MPSFSLRRRTPRSSDGEPAGGLVPAGRWAVAGALLGLGVAVAAQGVRPRPAPPETPRAAGELRVFEGVSTEGDFQQALDRAVAQALRALPGADRRVEYRVRSITGAQGGLRGENVVRVAIEVPVEEGAPVAEAPPLPAPPPAPAPAGPAAEALRSALVASLRLSATRVPQGRPVTFALTVRNRSARPVRIPFRSGRQYDFEVWRGEQLVYRWSQGRVFTQALTALTLAPNQAMTFSIRWDQRNNDGAPVPPGEYVVHGYLPAAPPDTPAGLRIGATAALTITRP